MQSILVSPIHKPLHTANPSPPHKKTNTLRYKEWKMYLVFLLHFRMKKGLDLM